MFGLTIDKVLILAVIAVFLIGPQRLPAFAGRLAQLVRSVRDMTDGAKSRMREEMGPEFDKVDWAKLDPRQYDPRRIIRDALLEEPGAHARTTISAPRPHDPAESRDAAFSPEDQQHIAPHSPSSQERN